MRHAPAKPARSAPRPLTPLFTSVLFAAALPATLWLGGCAGPPPAPRIGPGTLSVLPMSLDRAGDSVVIVVRSPSPGWKLTVDRAIETFGRTDVFITACRPDPRATYASREVEQRLATPLLAQSPLAVYTRIAPPQSATPRDDPYVFVLADPADPLRR